MTMLEAIIREFPITDFSKDFKNMSNNRSTYTKEEVDNLIAEALAEARRIDEESMRKHNRDATVISMILGFTALALFVDGLLRLLGIIPPFMGIDIDLLDKIVEKVEVDALIQGAVDEARRIDEESMKKHNRDATVISMVLGFTALALFVDGLLRLLGIIPPFMGIDIDLLDKIVEKVEGNVIDKIRQVPIQKLLGR